MQIKGKSSKKGLSLYLLSMTLFFGACGTNQLQNNNDSASVPVKENTFIDWTKDRVYYQNENFKIKLFSDSIKSDATEALKVDYSKLINTSSSVINGKITSTAGSATISGESTLFLTELKAGDKIIIDDSGEVLTVQSVSSDTSFTATSNAVNTVSTASFFHIITVSNNHARNYGAMSVHPAISTNGTTPTGDDVLYFSSSNKSGSNVFAVNADGSLKWEQKLNTSFEGSSPSFSPKLGNVMYLVGKNGTLYCIDTDGKVLGSYNLGDNFKNSVWIDSSNADYDYVYAAGEHGNFFRLKVEFDNAGKRIRSISQIYKTQLTNAGFSSSPVMTNNSIYIGSDAGVLYEVVPNTGLDSRSWDLSQYGLNGSGAIIGNPLLVVSGGQNLILVPAGGYMFRIIGSNVTQGPLLEITSKSGVKLQPYGSVFNSNEPPSGNISSSPIINGNNIYISNGNAVFQMDYSTASAFANSARYAVSLSGRLGASSGNLKAMGNGSLTISNGKIAMVDVNVLENSTPYINYFNLASFGTATDPLVRYMPLNEFDSEGHLLSGVNSSAIAGTGNNVFFALNNGKINILQTP